jgi:hypothetical protein
VSRRTETAYKAQSAGKLAQHNESPGSADRVNAAVVQRQFTHLIRGDLTDPASAAAKEVGLRPSAKALEPPPNPKAATEARCAATQIVVGQKSAEAVVAQRPA